jgi:hypothetical protein
MRDKSQIVVRIIAFLLIVWGLWISVYGVHGIWLSLQCLFTCSNVDLSYVWFVIFNFAYSVVLSIIALTSACGLIKFRSWARVSALTICSVVLLSGLYSAVRFAVDTYQYQGVPPRPVPEGAVLIDVSMWPAYVTGLVSGISVLLLVQDFVKRGFMK